jgi:hypothetical protein
MHKYVAFDTTCGEGRELRAFARLEAFDGFDQADGADRDQILEVLTRIIELFDVVDTNPMSFLPLQRLFASPNKKPRFPLREDRGIASSCLPRDTRSELIIFFS